MKSLSALVGLVCLITLLLPACAPAPEPEPEAQSMTAAPALKSHHLFNLPEGVTEAEVVAALREANRVIADSGYPNAGYRLWKVTSEQSGEYSYLFEGVWPDQATYDAIHDLESYKKAFEQFPEYEQTLERVMEDEVYNRFIEIPTGGPPGT